MKCGVPECNNEAIYFYSWCVRPHMTHWSCKCEEHMAHARKLNPCAVRIFMTEAQYTVHLVEAKLIGD